MCSKFSFGSSKVIFYLSELNEIHQKQDYDGSPLSVRLESITIRFFPLALLGTYALLGNWYFTCQLGFSMGLHFDQWSLCGKFLRSNIYTFSSFHFVVRSLAGTDETAEDSTRHLFMCYPIRIDKLLIPSSTLAMEKSLCLLMLNKFLANELVVELLFVWLDEYSIGQKQLNIILQFLFIVLTNGKYVCALLPYTWGICSWLFNFFDMVIISVKVCWVCLVIFQKFGSVFLVVVV